MSEKLVEGTAAEDGGTVVDAGETGRGFGGRLASEEWRVVGVAAAILAVAVAYRVLTSPYGEVFQAIRENEQRAEFVGLNVWRYKLMSFVLSGAFAGVADWGGES